jgi:hypothetical protein
MRQEETMGSARLPQRVWRAAPEHAVGRPVIVIATDISGSCKTTVSSVLAAALGRQFQEGDHLHPRENVEKMHGGAALTEVERTPWLHKIADEIGGRRARRTRHADLLGAEAMRSAARSAIMIVGAFVSPRTTLGLTEASATRLSNET